MEDDLMRLFGAERILGIVNALKMPEDMPINARILSGAIERAQKNLEDANFKRRKYVLSYDDVMNRQRTIIYGQRQDVLNGKDISGTVQKMLTSTVETTVAAFLRGEHRDEWDLDGLRAHFLGTVTGPDDLRYSPEELRRVTAEDISDLLCDRVIEKYHEKEALFGAETFREVERAILLRSVDTAWMNHIDVMEDLKNNVSLQGYAQRDPINEYRIQGAELFDGMVDDIRQNTLRGILSVVPREQPIRRVQIARPLGEGFEGSGENARQKKVRIVNKPATAAPRVGRNDPCPCGSGKKYKNCCMRKEQGGN